MKTASITREECARRSPARAGDAGKTARLNPSNLAAQQQTPQRVIGFAVTGADIQSIPGRNTAPHRIES